MREQKKLIIMPIKHDNELKSFTFNKISLALRHSGASQCASPPLGGLKASDRHLLLPHSRLPITDSRLPILRQPALAALIVFYVAVAFAGAAFVESEIEFAYVGVIF